MLLVGVNTEQSIKCYSIMKYVNLLNIMKYIHIFQALIEIIFYYHLIFQELYVHQHSKVWGPYDLLLF